MTIQLSLIKIDFEVSWTDYILVYFKTRFTIYALPLVHFLKHNLRFELSLQTTFSL